MRGARGAGAVRSMIARLVAVCLLATALVPAAAGDHPCPDERTLVRLRVAEAGAFHDSCAGVFVRENAFPCIQILWGVQTDVAGAGGHSFCEAFAYVALP